MKVYKRNGTEQDFCSDKIKNAVSKANKSVDKDHQMNDEQLDKIVATVQKKLEKFDTATVEDIQDLVEQALVKHNKYEVSKAYIIYRDNKRKEKKFSEIEEKCLSILDGTSVEARGDNANKKVDLNSSIRDYIAGTVCKSIAEKILPKKIMDAHKKGIIHFHDSDYSPAQPLHNCDLTNIEDMLENGFQMGDTHIDPPKRFSTACNLVAQIALIVSGSQYGGQTMSWAHLLPVIKTTFEDCEKQLDDILSHVPKFIKFLIKPFRKKMVERMVKHDIHVGIKTYQYQIICHHSSNGQSPFVSNVLNLREAQNDWERKWLSFIIEEIIDRRTKGVKDEKGHWISPLFPKLLYWECEGLNVNKDDPYYYLTKKAAICCAKRMQPDIMSEKKGREIKSGQIIPVMGCRSALSPIWEEVTYPIDTLFDWQFKADDNIKYEGAPGYNINYGRPLVNSSLPLGDGDDTSILINFRGNTGWVYKYSLEDNTVTILQPKVYGRWNNGVVSINIPHAALTAKNNLPETATVEELKEEFFKVFDERLELCHEALKRRNEACRKIKAKNSPILWQYGVLYRTDNPEMTVGEIMDRHPTRASISLGYAGLCETSWAIIGESNTSEKGRKFCKEVMQHMNDLLDVWKANEHLGYSIYGTPIEATTYKFARSLQRDFGFIEHITDKDYVVNSYHVDPREPIDAFLKLKIEGEFLSYSTGGAVSYVETPNMIGKEDVIEDLFKYMYDNIFYAEINTKLGICYKCGFEGEIKLTKTKHGDFEFECPHCHNKDDYEMNVEGRMCGYMGKISGENRSNHGRMDDYVNRCYHVDVN